MKSSFKKIPGSKIEGEVVLDQSDFKPYWDSAFESAMSKVELKGFRPGTAPKELAEQAVDKDKVFEEAARDAVRFSLDKAIEENQWTLIDQPRIELLFGESGLKYKAILTVFPEIKLGNYKKIAKKIFAEKTEIKVEPAEVERSLDWLRNSRAKTVRVSREARKGDVVDINFESFIDGKAVEERNLKSDKFILGQGHFMPGFEEKLENREEGENLVFSLTAPSDYWQENLRSKNIEFRVKINAVFQRDLPELTDEFVKGLGQFQSAEELKKSVYDGLLMEKKQKEQERKKAKILEEIIKDSRIDLPEIMVEKTLSSMIVDLKPMIQSSGKSEEEIRSRLKPRAESNVSNNLVIYKIAKLEHLEPTKEEVEAEARAQNLDVQKFYDYSYSVVQNKKVFKYLESL